LSSAWSTSTSRRGPDAGDLAAQLRADRAAGAGDEHDLAGQVRADPVDLHHDRLAAEDVLDLHVADLADEVAAGVGPARARVAQELEDGREGPHGQPALAGGAGHAGAQRAGGRRDRDEHLVRLGVVEDPLEVDVGVAEDLDPLDAHAAQARVVVDEADRASARGRVAQDLAQDEAARRRRRRR
jgi:hypothetical protein